MRLSYCEEVKDDKKRRLCWNRDCAGFNQECVRNCGRFFRQRNSSNSINF